MVARCAAAGIDIDQSYRELMLEIRVGGPASDRLCRGLSCTVTPEVLSERQVEMLSLMADGLNAAETAVEMGIAVDTVRFMTKRVRSRLKARSTLHAVAIVLRRGLI